MKFLLTAAASLAIALGATCSDVSAQGTLDFGTAPSGAVPVLFNDRHVYVKPDKVTSGRLLAAFVRGHDILIPLRSLFEQMGATVTYDAQSKTATVQTRNVRASLIVGNPYITINDVVRPLNVPAEIDDGQVLVPVRVLVETLGGYVRYLPDIHAVTIRYLGPTDVRNPAPPVEQAPAVAPPVPSAPVVRATVGPGPPIPVGTPDPETFVLVETLVAPKVANAAAPVVSGATGTSFNLVGEDEFSILDVNFDFGGNYKEYRYAHPSGNVTQPGGSPVTFEPAFDAIDRDYGAHLGVQLSPQKYYLVVAYSVDHLASYPRIGGIGAGLKKLPNLNRHFDYDFDAFYYPNMSGHCGSCAMGAGSEIAFKRLVYAIGLAYSIRPLFLDVEYTGDKGYAKGSATDDFTHSGIAAGLGLRF